MGWRGTVITGGDGKEGGGSVGIVCLATARINFLRVGMGLSPVVHSRSIYGDLSEVKGFGESTPETKK